MKISYYPDTGLVAYINRDEGEEGLTTIDVPDDPRLHQGYIVKYLGGNLIFEETPFMLGQ